MLFAKNFPPKLRTTSLNANNKNAQFVRLNRYDCNKKQMLRLGLLFAAEPKAYYLRLPCETLRDLDLKAI